MWEGVEGRREISDLFRIVCVTFGVRSKGGKRTKFDSAPHQACDLTPVRQSAPNCHTTHLETFNHCAAEDTQAVSTHTRIHDGCDALLT